jgi:hypothetical protein
LRGDIQVNVESKIVRDTKRREGGGERERQRERERESERERERERESGKDD